MTDQKSSISSGKYLMFLERLIPLRLLMGAMVESSVAPTFIIVMLMQWFSFLFELFATEVCIYASIKFLALRPKLNRE